jgi:hypothetical protein
VFRASVGRPCYTFAMALVSTPTGAAVICGHCGARYEFAPSYDRRLPLSAAIAAGWGAARNDKGIFDYTCPDCVACRVVEGSPIAVPDDEPLPPQSTETTSQAPPWLPARSKRHRRRPSRRR